MLGLDDHAHALGFSHLHDGLRDLGGEGLLDLQPAGEHVHQSRHLGEADYLAGGNIGHVALADKGQQVVFAQRVQFHVLYQDHLAGVGGEQGFVHHILHCLAVAAGEEFKSLGGTLRCVGEPGTLQVLADSFYNFRPVLFHRFSPYFSRSAGPGPAAGHSNNYPVGKANRQSVAAIGYTSLMTESHDTAAQPRTVGEAISYCHDALEAGDVHFGHGTDNAWDEAVQLVLSVADLPLDADDGVLPHPLGEDMRERLEALLRRRIKEHIPLPYLLGRAWFAGLEFRCDRRAIVPRSPLAELILNGFNPWYAGPSPQRVLDLCCGGGCIGLAVAHYFPEARVDLVDIDSDALALAAENRKLLDLEQQVAILQSDLFQQVGEQRYDLIVSNPPYVDAADLAAMPAEYRHEPELALGSGADGLYLTRRILVEARQYLHDHGLLVVEVGNSWEALEQACPQVPFTWLEFAHGGHGVFALTAAELQDYAESLGG